MISQLGFAFPMALERSNKCLKAYWKNNLAMELTFIDNALDKV